MEDALIVELYWRRSERAIDESEIKYGRYCRAISYNILGDARDADECVNDTWLRAWNAMPDARPTLLSAFLAKITRNLSLNRYRTKRAAKRGGGLDALIDELDECAADARCTEDAFDAAETARLLDEFLFRLDERSRVFFVRRYFYADSIAYIANRYGKSESLVKSDLFRTRGKLRAFLDERGVQ